MKHKRTHRAAAAKAARGAPGKGRSRYARKHRAQARGTFSRTSPFADATSHTLVDPPGPRETWARQKPLLSADRLRVLLASVVTPINKECSTKPVHAPERTAA